MIRPLLDNTSCFPRLLFASILVLLIACSEEDEPAVSSDDDDVEVVADLETTFGIFTVQEDRTTIEMNGVITSSSLDDFNELIDSHPDINLINIIECEGSDDDEINLLVAARVHSLMIDTHIVDEGLVASGGTDFFLAGINRSIGTDVLIGVHSWAGTDDNGNDVVATDFTEGDEMHQPYIDYYVSVGFTQENAEAFYYFTINAAPFDDIHWMTDEELETYGILN